ARGSAVAWREDRGVRGSRSGHHRRNRRSGLLVGRLVHRPEQERAGGRAAQGLTTRQATRSSASSNQMGSGLSTRPTRYAASPISTLADRPASRSSPIAVAPSALLSFEPSARRISG